MISLPTSTYLVHLHDRPGVLDADEGLGERHRPEAPVEEEEADVRVDAQEAGDVDVVGERRRESDNADDRLREGRFLNDVRAGRAA